MVAIGCRKKEKFTSRQHTSVPKQIPYPPKTILERESDNMFVKLPIFVNHDRMVRMDVVVG